MQFVDKLPQREFLVIKVGDRFNYGQSVSETWTGVHGKERMLVRMMDKYALISLKSGVATAGPNSTLEALCRTMNTTATYRPMQRGEVSGAWTVVAG